MNDDFEPAFDRLDEVKPAALKLLADPLSDLTRRRQGLLLIVASVTLLLSYAVVEPGSADVLGVNLKLERPDVLPALCGLVTAYFLVLYLLGVYADWSVRRVKRWSPYVAFKRFGSATERDMAEKGNVVRAHVTALVSEVRDTKDLSEERDRKIQPLEEQLDALKERLVGGVEPASAIGKKLRAVHAQISNIRDEYLERIQEANRQSEETPEPLPSFKPIEITQDEIKEALVRERRITRVRLAAEVLVPSALGIMAVVRTLLLD